MTWAEIMAWNIGQRVERTGLLISPWVRMMAALPETVLSVEECEARNRLGHSRFEYWVRMGAADARNPTARM